MPERPNLARRALAEGRVVIAVATDARAVGAAAALGALAHQLIRTPLTPPGGEPG